MLIVSGCEGATQRYRCFNHDEQLRLSGIRSRVVSQGHPDLQRLSLGYGFVILHRVALDTTVATVIAQARDSGGVVLFDIDDLVFEPKLTQWHHGVTHLAPADQALYHDGVRRYRQTLLACDGAIVPTEFLAAHVRALGKPCWISRNCLDLELLRLSAAASAPPHRPADEPAVIGYASGTWTHDRDFEVAGPALRRVLDRHPEVVLRTVGPLQLGPEWQRHAERIDQRAAVDWRRLPEELAAFDINLAPLEIGNPFCESKSELKWLEAAACAVPTVAAATGAFAAAIREGTTGLLARTETDWEAALEELLADPARRRAIGRAAARAVSDGRTTAAQAAAFEAVLAAARLQARPERLPPPPGDAGGRGLRVSLLLPEPTRGSGGHMSVMRMAGGLAQAGHEVRVHVDRGPTFSQAGDEDLAAFFRAHFPPAEAAFHLGRRFAPADVAVATAWSTALAVATAENARARGYFVQDFEPFFQPMGRDYVAAEATYRLGLEHITLGPWLSDLLRGRYAAMAEPIDFGVDHAVYRPGAPSDRPRVVFYARGSTPRRGTELGLAALGLVKAARAEVEVVLYGSHQPAPVTYEHTQGGVMAPEDLAVLYRTATVGLVLSYTNLSFVPFELMASGCPVVAVDVEPVRWFLRHAHNALLGDSLPEALAEAVLGLLEDEPLRRRLSDAGRRDVAELSWERSIAQFEAHVQAIARRDRSHRPGHPRARPVPVLDGLNAHGGEPLRLAPGQAVGWEIACGADGLHRVDLRLTAGPRPARGTLMLAVKEHATAIESLAVASVEVPEVFDGAWQALELASLGRTAGRRFHLSLELHGDPAGRGVTLDCSGEGQPAYRTWGLSPAPPAGRGYDARLVRRLGAVEHELAAIEVAAASLARSRSGALVRWWRRLAPTMPPGPLRPWPEAAPAATKLWRGLRTYGPVALGREAWSYRQWRKHRGVPR